MQDDPAGLVPKNSICLTRMKRVAHYQNGRQDPADGVGRVLSSRNRALSLVVAFVCMAGTLFGVYRLVFRGPFSWHMQQPDFSSGIAEFATLWLLGALTFAFLKGWRRWLLLSFLLALYMRLHGTDLALALAGLYALGIYGVGTAVCPDGVADTQPGYRYRTFALRSALGLSVMAAFLMLGAWIFRFDFAANRIAALALATCGLVFWGWRQGWRNRKILRFGGEATWPVSCAVALLVATGAVAVARSNLPFYFDSAWYGLRPDRVLFGPDGFYQSLGLTTQVHYYPKLYELVIAPLQGLGDVSNVVVIGVISVGALVLATISLATTFGLRAKYALIVAALLVCYPAVLGTAETPKGDILACAFIVFAFVALIRAFELKSPRLLVDVAVYCLLASTLRLSVLPWLGILFLLWCIGLVVSMRPGWKRWDARDLLPLILVLPAFVLTHLRTYWLTGVPVITNSGMQARLDSLGLELKAPVGALTGAGEGGMGLFRGAEAFVKIGLMPDQFPLHVFKWMGAAWLVFGVVAVIRADRGFSGWRGGIAFIGFVVFPFLVMFNSWPAGAPAGDGNYFVVALALIYVCGAAAVRSFHPVALALLLACASAGTGSYLLGANWEVGTGRITRSLDRSPFDEDAQVTSYLARAGLDRLADHLGTCNRHTRLIGELRAPEAFLLPLRFEPFEELAWNNAGSFASRESFIQLIQDSATDLVALPAETAAPGVSRAKLTSGEVTIYATSQEGIECLVALSGAE